jgi:hypothetical protein
MFCARSLGICLRARAIVLEPKFIDPDEPAPVLVMPTQAHPPRKPIGVPYWSLCDWRTVVYRTNRLCVELVDLFTSVNERPVLLRAVLPISLACDIQLGFVHLVFCVNTFLAKLSLGWGQPYYSPAKIKLCQKGIRDPDQLDIDRFCVTWITDHCNGKSRDRAEARAFARIW